MVFHQILEHVAGVRVRFPLLVRKRIHKRRGIKCARTHKGNASLACNMNGYIGVIVECWYIICTLFLFENNVSKGIRLHGVKHISIKVVGLMYVVDIMCKT